MIRRRLPLLVTRKNESGNDKNGRKQPRKPPSKKTAAFSSSSLPTTENSLVFECTSRDVVMIQHDVGDKAKICCTSVYFNKLVEQEQGGLFGLATTAQQQRAIVLDTLRAVKGRLLRPNGARAGYIVMTAQEGYKAVQQLLMQQAAIETNENNVPTPTRHKRDTTQTSTAATVDPSMPASLHEPPVGNGNPGSEPTRKTTNHGDQGMPQQATVLDTQKEPQKNKMTTVDLSSSTEPDSTIRQIWATDIMLPSPHPQSRRRQPITNNAYFNHLLNENTDVYKLTKHESTKKRIVREMMEKLRVCGGRFLRLNQSSPHDACWRLLPKHSAARAVHDLLNCYIKKKRRYKASNDSDPKHQHEESKKQSQAAPPPHDDCKRKDSTQHPQFFPPFFPFYAHPFYMQPPFYNLDQRPIKRSQDQIKAPNVDEYYREANRTKQALQHTQQQQSAHPEKETTKDDFILETNHMDIIIESTLCNNGEEFLSYGDWNLQRLLLPHVEAYFVNMYGSPIHEYIFKDVTTRVTRDGGRFLVPVPSNTKDGLLRWRQASSTQRTKHMETVFQQLDNECTKLGNLPDWKHTYLQRIEKDLPWLQRPIDQKASSNVEPPKKRAKTETRAKQQDNKPPIPQFIEIATMDEVDFVDDNDNVAEMFATSHQHPRVMEGLLSVNPSLEQNYKDFFECNTFAPKGHNQDFVWLFTNIDYKDSGSEVETTCRRSPCEQPCHATIVSGHDHGGEEILTF